METSNENENIGTSEQSSSTSEPFKKPILVGKIGRLPKKVSQMKNVTVPDPINETAFAESSKDYKKPEQDNVHADSTGNYEGKQIKAPAQQIAEQSIPLPYKEPIWSGLPHSLDKDYSFEVLKNGSIIETLYLMDRSFWVFGRLNSCNISMQHPTISRYHAVLQYRREESETDKPGFYIYDLGSTHGTFLNKNRLKPKVYTRIQVGHMLRLGCSTRSYILNGPDYDEEEESELTVTELKQKRADEIARLEEAAREEERKEEERKRKEEEKGVDWGLGEDADEETDLSENPYAQTNNEELYLDDPKKALRGFFEREGLELEYDCTEQGIGQFLCKVELPVDDETGRPIVAEVIHKGKKKEAVVQCALEACRILDRYGVLRQATHESRKRKAKNWEENDYYDSDEDTFLDRTGTIEQKREKRMNAKQPQKAETYESLLEKEKEISQSITKLEKQLANTQAKKDKRDSQNAEEDSLDSFMKDLSDSKLDKQTICKLKLELTKMKTEHAKVIRLVNIAKPASLPPLVPHYSSSPSTSKDSKSNFPVFGKRKKIKVELPAKPASSVPVPSTDGDEEEEEEEDDEENKIPTSSNETEVEGKFEQISENSTSSIESPVQDNFINSSEIPSSENPNDNSMDQSNDNSSGSSSSSPPSGEDIEGLTDFTSIKSFHNTITFRKFEKILKKGLPPFAGKHQEKLQKILNTLKKLAASEDRMTVDWKMLTAKKRKVMKLISDLRNCEPNEKLEHKISSELNRILSELNIMTEHKCKVIDKVKKMGNEIKSISEAIDKDFEEYKKGMAFTNRPSEKPESSSSATKDSDEKMDNSETESSQQLSDSGDQNDERKKKKNQGRIQQRQRKAEVERQRGYEEDANREGYDMWVPPSNQSGDGRIPLNDKLGY